MLEQIGIYNDLSDGLRAKLEEKISGFGKKVRYKFDISHLDPDPEKKHTGAVVYPSKYSLKPRTFKITDKDETRAGKQKVKTIGIVLGTDPEKGTPNRFGSVSVREKDRGVLEFDLENPEHLDMIAMLELHPKLKGGMFADNTKKQMVERIDELQLSKANREKRSARAKALNAAQSMSDAEVQQFADAMNWEVSFDPGVLRDRIEEMAETTPELFNDLVGSKKLEYQATIKRALDANIISHDPSTGKFMWAATQQAIVVLGQSADGRLDTEHFAEWLMTNGEKATEVFKKIKSLQKAEKAVS